MAREKITCQNPNTGSSMNIDRDIYDLFHEAISTALGAGETLTYTEIVDMVKKHLKKTRASFSGSVSWYCVTVKNDMQSRGQLDVVTKQGKKLHKLNKP
ncbi:MAG TPA: hypothetical protein VK166_19080 [Chitinophagaceae bacterium]|nr:hypothetical protein [Chitinophagaceae bacterium]